MMFRLMTPSQTRDGRMGYVQNSLRSDGRRGDLWPDMREENNEDMNMRGASSHMKPHEEDEQNTSNLEARLEQMEEEVAHLKGAMEMFKSIPMVDDMNPELTEKIEALLNAAASVAMKPPKTWRKYLDEGDFAGLVKMESTELMEALKKDKLPKEIQKELTHTIAAVLRAGV